MSAARLRVLQAQRGRHLHPHQVDYGVLHRHFNALSLAGKVALAEGGEYADGGVQAAAGVAYAGG